MEGEKRFFKDGVLAEIFIGDYAELSLNEKLKYFSYLKDKKAECDGLIKKLNAEIDRIKDLAVEDMTLKEVRRMTIGDYNFSLQAKTRWSKKGGMDEEFFTALKNHGLGDLIKETVNANSLSAALNELTDQSEDDSVPSDIEEVVNRYDFIDIQRRKASTAAKKFK